MHHPRPGTSYPTRTSAPLSHVSSEGAGTAMKIDHQIEAPRPQAPAKCDVGQNILAWGNDDFIDV